MLEDEPVGVHGVIPGKIFNGEMRGHKGEFYLKCHNCGLVLDSQSYKKIRKFQKKTKKAHFNRRRINTSGRKK